MRQFSHNDMIIRKLGQGEEKILFFGDSNVEQYAPRIDRLYQSSPNAKSALFVTDGGLSPLPSTGRNIKEYNFTEEALKISTQRNFSTIVIGASWLGKFNNPTYNHYDSNKQTHGNMTLLKNQKHSINRLINHTTLKHKVKKFT